MSSEDHGQAPEEIVASLEMWNLHRNDLTRAALVSSIANSRLLVPLVQQGTGVQPEMVQVTFQSNDGRTALLAFTSLDDLNQFNESARPFPKRGSELALETLEKNLDGMIVDIASSHRFSLSITEVASMAQNQAT